MKRAWDIFTLLRRLILFGVIGFVGYFALLANRKPQVVKEKRKITITANANTTDTTIEIIQPENPEANPNIHEMIQKVNDQSAKDAIAAQLNGAGSNRESRTITLVHLHSPADEGSRELARTIEDVRAVYRDQLLVTTIDTETDPDQLTHWRVASAPSVVFQTDRERLFSFEGVWSEHQLDAKVRELIHGLQRVDKNWRPPVQGMEAR